MKSKDEMDDLQRQLSADFARAAALAHLDYELLEAYVDGRGDAVNRQTVKEHVRHCATCAAELRDLQQFAAARTAPRRHRILYWIAAACAALAMAGVMIWRIQHARPGNGPARAQIGPTLPSRPEGTEELLRDVPPRWSAAARDALHTGTLPTPAILGELAPAHGTLRGHEADAASPLREPVGVVVLSDRPAFTWSAVAPDATYVVSVFAPGPKLAAQSPRLDTTTWTPARPLPRGTTYIWQLAIRREGAETIAPRPPASPARFHIVDEQTRAEVEEARASGSHLAAAVADGRAGLQAEAERELAALAAKHPGNAEVGRLLDSVRRRP